MSVEKSEVWSDDSLPPGEYVKLAVSDTGGGMDSNILNQIFTPFFTTKEAGKGTGLGLSIAQSIIEMHKGHIDVKSEKGKGSQFIVTLPLDKLN